MSNYPKAVEELSFSAILNGKKDKLQELLPELYSNFNDSDPAVALLEVSAYSEGILRNRLNNSLLAVMIQYATSTDFDNLGTLYGVKRKLIEAEDNSSIPPTPAIWESDERLRARIIEAPKGLSTAGTRSGYQYWGKKDNDKVKDISAVSTVPMEVDITVLSYEGKGEASEELIEAVATQLNDEDVRPMGDKVSVAGAEIIEFNVDIQVVFKTSNVVDKDSILERIRQNLDDYVKAEHRLGGFISQAGINACAFEDKILDVAIILPNSNIRCELNQAPYCLDINIEEKDLVRASRLLFLK